MNITIIGTGNMGRGIGTRALAGGNNVTLVGHRPGEAENLAAELQGAAQGGASVRAAPAGAPLADDVIVLAVPYTAAASVVQQYGDQLAGKIVVDITNPVDFSTIVADTLVAGQVGGQSLDVFIAGDDAEAKAIISQLVASAGLRAVDVGPLQRARQLEALGLLHMVVQPTLGTGFGSAVKILA